MAKNYSNRNKKRKALIAMLCALSVTCTGLAAACAPTEEDKPSTAVTAKEDTQLIKNGNFERFDIPDKAIHLIKNVNSWSLGGGTSVKSGIIGTSKSDWDKLTDDGLAGKLDYNNDLSADNENYVNYNSMRSRDIPYKDTYAATLTADKVADSWVTKHDEGYEGYFGITGEGTEEKPYKWNGLDVKKDGDEFYIADENGDFTKLIRKELIENPGTHYGDFKEEDGKYYYGTTQVYADDKGNYYDNDKLEGETVGNVLMVHNAGTGTDNNGLQQYYTSNSITLEAHTSAEISLWVKTTDLRFNKGYFADENETEKGAFIEVIQTVAGKSVDSFQIKAINTQNINTTDENNGWVQYTVYVNACDFASTSIQLRLGLGGETENEKVTGYAFFDDVQVTKYRDLSAEKCTYDATKVTNTTCTLTSEKDDKIFYAEGEHLNDFHYLIDLASIMSKENTQHNYTAIDFGDNVEIGLTTEKDSKDKEYAAATSIDTTKILNKKTQTGLNLPKDVNARPTNEDILKVVADDKDFGKYSTLLNNVIGDNKAPELLAESNGNTLLMFSAWGAPYTATLTEDTTFTLAHDEYLLVSFWVKTSDMDGSTAATAKIYELNGKGLVDADSVQTITIDTTDKTTDFDKNDKDIYNGWVQCFFFVKNDTKTNDKTFKIDLSFGATEIISTTSYKSGYAAFANLQVLEINKDIYELASDGDTTKLFAFSKDSTEDGGTAFAEATGTYDINEGIALPDKYTGVNGNNVYGSLTNTAGKNIFVDANEKLNAGLINRDSFNDYPDTVKNGILTSFISGATEWDKVFGNNCYQPLIIINNLREYASVAKANETNYTEYWIKNDDGSYSKATEWKADEKYYSLNEVVNYGFVGEDKTVSANGREVISVRVKVTGDAEAYIYLINTDNTEETLNFTTPSITYWYDEEGNVLDAELDEDWTTAQHREHIVYTLRDDGLYDGKDGKLYANLDNLIKSYKDSKYESVAYYDKDGNPVAGGYDYVEKHDGETFYKDKNGTIADHYLCTTDGTHVYEFKDGKYYYVEITKNDDKTTETTNFEKEVNNFNTTPRYDKSEISEELFVTVKASDCDPTNADSLCDENGWVTVNFILSAGSEAKKYRLELWSGERGVTGVGENGTYKTGAVAFDYSHKTVSENTLKTYEKEIINAYNNALLEFAPDSLKDEALDIDANIADYENFIESLKETDADAAAKIVAAMADYKYKASYYTYTLYDSTSYVPFNATTASEGETGYDYDASSFDEKLAYFEFEDKANSEKNIFVDYTTVDQSISKNTVDSDDDDEDEAPANTAELGLYISSIVLVVVLLITLASILITQYVKKNKKAKGPKNSEKNAYRKRDRYVKKLHLVKDEIVEPENGENEVTEVPAEEVTPEENEVTEAPAKEPAETVEPEAVEPEVAEPATEEPATEEPTSPADGEDKE